MKVIAPYSPELREIKAKAIIAMDKPLLEQLQQVEAETFIYCETFLDALMASSDESNDLPTVEASSLRNAIESITEGR
jgi:hypothetical protein